jgi:hypothetical protein
MIKNYQHITDSICDKFHNVISSFDIIAWLDNFERKDWKKALIVLENFEYYSTNEIIKEFEMGLSELLEDVPTGKIYFLPVGKIGKSGSAMIYYLKKTPKFSNSRIVLLEKEDFNKIEDNANLVIVDDFSGTGNTIIEYIDLIKEKLPENYNVYILTIAYMLNAKITLENIGVKIYGNLRNSIFSKRGSVFGYYPKMKAIREFCFKYGNLLYPLAKYTEKKTKHHPLGFDNSQVLLGFEHSIPNNVLPIIWADKKVKGKNWVPIFPRRGKLLIDKANEIKHSEKYWASIFFKLGLNEGIYSIEERYNKQTLQLLSVIRLKRKKRNPISICHILGINLNEYENIINKGINKKLFNSSGDLTKQGINIYEQINKKVKFLNIKEEKQELLIEEDMLYIPKTFRGSS